MFYFAAISIHHRRAETPARFLNSRTKIATGMRTKSFLPSPHHLTKRKYCKIKENTHTTPQTHRQAQWNRVDHTGEIWSGTVTSAQWFLWFMKRFFGPVKMIPRKRHPTDNDLYREILRPALELFLTWCSHCKYRRVKNIRALSESVNKIETLIIFVSGAY